MKLFNCKIGLSTVSLLRKSFGRYGGLGLIVLNIKNLNDYISKLLNLVEVVSLFLLYESDQGCIGFLHKQ